MEPPETRQKATKPNLKSTSYRYGTSAYSVGGGFDSLASRDVAPLIARDLANAELVGDLDFMLKTFLRIAHGEDIKLEPSPMHMTGLLERALKYVCKDVCQSESIRCYLNDYCNAATETQRYAPFIDLCNEALGRMKDAVVDEGLRTASPLKILFARNDPQLRRQSYKLHDGSQGVWETKLKPDIIVRSLLEAQTRYSRENDSLDDIIKLAVKAPRTPPKPSKVRGTHEPSKSSELSDAPHSPDAPQSPDITQIPDVAQLSDAPHSRPSVFTKSKKSVRWEGILGFCEFKMSNLTIKTEVEASYTYTDKPKRKSVFDLKFGINSQAFGEPVSATTRLRKRAAEAMVGPDPPGEKTKWDEEEPLSQTPDTHISSMSVQYNQASKLPAAVQAGIYGANMINRPGATAHAIGFVVRGGSKYKLFEYCPESASIVDEWVWLWWYDRQGSIQVAALDLVTELPRFLVLLLCLQRFSLQDWGFVPELDSLAISTHLDRDCVSPITIEYQSCTVSLEHDPEALRFCLTGRGTSTAIVRNVQQNEGGPLMNLPPWAVRGDQYHLKLAWIDDTRESEAKIVKTVRDRLSEEGDHDNRIGHHLPWIVDSKDHGLSTGTIRKEFNFNPVAITRVDGEWVEITASRLLRTIIAEKLQPVADLDPLDYFKIHLDIAGCLFGCWNVGVGHRDPRLTNFMYRMIDGQMRGVLNDFDLGIIEGSTHSAMERTGTIPYMALELLMDPSGRVLHRLTHDLEATYWVMCWVVYCSPSGEIPRDFASWRQGDYHACSISKSAWQNTHNIQFKARPGWGAIEYVLEKLRIGYRDLTLARIDKLRDQSPPPSPTGEDVLEATPDSAAEVTPDPAAAGGWSWYANIVVDACKRWRRRQDGDDTLIEPAKVFAQRWRDYGVTQLQ